MWDLINKKIEIVAIVPINIGNIIIGSVDSIFRVIKSEPKEIARSIIDSINILTGILNAFHNMYRVINPIKIHPTQKIISWSI